MLDAYARSQDALLMHDDVLMLMKSRGSAECTLGIHFLLFMTFEHISIKPTLASLSGNAEIALVALST